MPYSRPTLTFTAVQSASYTCMAENFHINGHSNVNSTAFVQVIGQYNLRSSYILFAVYCEYLFICVLDVQLVVKIALLYFSYFRN